MALCLSQLGPERKYKAEAADSSHRQRTDWKAKAAAKFIAKSEAVSAKKKAIARSSGGGDRSNGSGEREQSSGRKLAKVSLHCTLHCARAPALSLLCCTLLLRLSVGLGCAINFGGPQVATHGAMSGLRAAKQKIQSQSGEIKFVEATWMVCCALIACFLNLVLISTFIRSRKRALQHRRLRQPTQQILFLVIKRKGRAFQ